MSKNMTQKGLALGAAAALIAAGLSAVPANAAGLADTSFVSLVPSAGDEYNVLAITGSEFSLTSNEATAVSSGDLKWLVTDASGVVEPKNSGSTLEALTFGSASASTTLLTVNITGHGLNTGDVVAISGVVIGTDEATDTFAADEEINNASYVVTKVNANSFTVAETFADALLAATPAANGSALFIKPATGTVTVLRTVRSAASTYVVDSGSTSDTSDEIVILVKDASVTARTVTVQAWMDANDNSLIDSTEYTSPVRTVNWLAAASVTAVTTVDYPVAGAANVTGSVVLTPNLNGDQQNAATDVQIGFTRPGSTATIYANATQNAVTRGWSASQSLAAGNWVGMPHIAQISALTNASPSLITVTPATIDIKTADVVLTAGTDNGDGSFAATAVASAPSTTTFTLTGRQGTAQETAGGYAQVVSRTITAAVGTAGVSALYTTTAKHGLSIGDLVTTAGGSGNNTLRLTRAAVTSVPSAVTFTLAATTITAATFTAGSDTKVTYVSFTEAVAGAYNAKTKVNATVVGNTSSSVTIASSSADTSLSTTGTVNVQGVTNDTAATTATIAYVRDLEKSVELTATIVDANDDAVTANRPVVVTLGNPDAAGDRSGTFTVNGTAYTAAVTLLTDANGQVTFTVADNDGATTTQTNVLVQAEGLTGAAAAEMDLIWAPATYSVLDLNDVSAITETGYNSITAGGSYAYALSVMDQWKSAPADGTHRVKYQNTGRTASTGYVTLSSGKGSLTVSDTAIGAETAIATALVLEKLGTTGVWATTDTLNDGVIDSDGTLTYNTSVVATTQVDAVFLDTNGSTAYGSDVADLSADATTVATVAQDRRVTNSVRPGYAAGSSVDVTGRVANSLTNAVRGGASVTISGPSNILFSDGAVDSLGSLTLRADASGEFAVELFSNTAQVDTVITVTSGAGSKTVKVTFIGQGASFGTAISIDAPTSVMPGTSFKVTATLTDKNGNAVVNTTSTSATVGRMLVTYTGPGITIAAMPTQTDAKGQVSFTVLLGTNDSGTGVVTVSYDQGDDADFTGTTAADKDVTATKTITVGAVASATKVNAGSFKGYVALYAKGYKGQRMSAKVGKDWVVVASLASDFERVVEFTGAGVDVAVRIYIDRVLMDTINLTTK